MNKYPLNLMVDLETTDTIAGSAILSIGAVAFDDKEIAKEQFYLPIDLASCLEYGLTINADTFKWWKKQSVEAQAVWFDPNGVSLDRALNAYRNWVMKVTGNNHSKAVLWSNGPEFDAAIMSYAFRKTGIQDPIKFCNNDSYRGLKRTYKKDVTVVRESGGSSASHNALVDAREQARHLIEINKFANGRYLQV